MSKETLGNIRVLDLSQCISGPYCTRLLAGWGAEVIKVEKPGEGDGARSVGPFPQDEPHPERSALFLYLNTNKKSITLDHESTTGAAIIKRLVKDVDVLIENIAPGVMGNLGLDYASLQELNPALVMTSISSFGQTGPYRDYKATSVVNYAMGGQMYVCGQPDREPLNTAVSLGEYIGGLYGFVGTMMALYHRMNSGVGQYVDVSIMECMAGSHQFTLTWPAYSGVLLERPGWPGSRAPLSFYACKDGYVNLRVQGIDPSLLAHMFDMPELADDPRFQTLEARTENIEALRAIMTEKLAKLNKKDIFRIAGEWRALCGYVATPEDLLSDPQYLSRGFWATIDHPCVGKLPYPGAPVRMTETGWQTERAPLLGEHNEEIYCQRLGFSKRDLVQLRTAGVI